MAVLADLTWPEVEAGAAGWLLTVPVGATEQHGPHLPLSTDTDVAVALAGLLDAGRDDVVIAPAIAFGSSGEHAGFAGTLSIGQEATESTIVELVRSADRFAGVVLVCGHGGNADPVARAVRTLTGEGRRVLAWSPRVDGGDAHAGRTETSLLLALGRPVRETAAEPGETRPIAELAGVLRTRGVLAVSPNGVLGDPTGASTAEGHALLRRLGDDLLACVATWTGTGSP